MFSRVRPGFPWWWWFSVDGRHEVFRVVRDGSGGLWVNDNGTGCRLDEFRGKPLEEVQPAQEVDTHETICMTADEVMQALEEAAVIYMVQQQRTVHVGDEFLGVWEAVQPFFTLKAAETYLFSHSHELENPRVAELEAEDNPEWKAVLKLLKRRLG